MVIEKTAYFCGKDGCGFYSFSRPKTEEHEKIPIKKDSLSGLILFRPLDETYTLVERIKNLTQNHEPLYSWSIYQGPELKEKILTEDERRFRKNVDKIFSFIGLEKEAIIEYLTGERSKNIFLGEELFGKTTSQFRAVYPERYPEEFKFRRNIEK